MQRLSILIAVVLSLLAIPAAARAATVDGATGPWADAVTSYAPSTQTDGGSVRATRRDTAAALGTAENDLEEGTFTSLGFGGQIVLRFDNPVCDQPGADLRVVEATRGAYREERAQVDVSTDGTTWLPALRALRGSYDGELPDGVADVHYVRITDVSSRADFTGDADGFDVDGVAALHPTGPCVTGADGNDASLALPAATPETQTPTSGGSADAIGILGVKRASCGTARRFQIRLRIPKRLGKSKRLKSVSVRLGKKKLRVRFKRGRYRATVDLRGRKPGRYTIRVRMVGKNGKVAKAKRRYKVCASKAKRAA